MDLSKENKELWNVETSPLIEKAYQLLLKKTDEINKELIRNGKDYRAANLTLENFIIDKDKIHLKHYIEEANIYLRREKIKKLKI
jgi:hypothetical protein